MRSSTKAGLGLAALAALLWSPNFYIADGLIAAETGPSSLAAHFHLVFWGAAGLMLLTFLSGRLDELSILNRRETYFLVLAAAGGYGFWMLRAMSLDSLDPDRAHLLIYAAPVFMGVFSLLGREPADGRGFFALVLGFVGCIMLVEGTGGETTGGSLQAHLLALGAAGCWAAFTVMARPLMREEKALPVAALVLSAGAACLLVTCLGTGDSVLSVSVGQLGLCVAGGAVSVGVAAALWLKALGMVPAVGAAPWWYMALVFGSVGRAVAQGRFGSQFWWLLGGTALVLMALGSASRGGARNLVTMSDVIRTGGG